MDENEKNANNKQRYSLISLDENIEREPEYYYSREHRLARASSAVQDLNDNKPAKKSFVKNLFGSRGNAVLFIMIIISCFMLSFVSRYTQSKADLNLGGNAVKLSIQMEEGMPILGIIKQNAKTGKPFIGEVEIAVSPVLPNLNKGETPPLFFHRIIFSHAENESFQILLPFDENEFILLLKTPGEQKSVKLRAK
jgi:hypothetical protein